MATTTATITFTEDITAANSSFTNAATLTQAGTTTGLDTILRGTKTLTATTNVDLISTTALVSAYTADVATKVYIANTGTSETEYFTIGMGAAASTQEEIGRLYGGDWMFIPWGVDDDITIEPNVATSMTVEYMVIS
tara:strand:+ start:953 stop:1363 length:411 start_codon:yes stop_codon:yes gene_type:complete